MDFTRLATAIIAVIVVLGGLFLAATDRISFAQWLEAVAIGSGGLAIGYGIDAKSKP